jgi:hypothetical protein
MQDFKPYTSFQFSSNVRAEFAYHRFLLVEKPEHGKTPEEPCWDSIQPEGSEPIWVMKLI